MSSHLTTRVNAMRCVKINAFSNSMCILFAHLANSTKTSLLVKTKLLVSGAHTRVDNFREKGQTKQRDGAAEQKRRLIIRLLANGEHRKQISVRDTTRK